MQCPRHLINDEISATYETVPRVMVEGYFRNIPFRGFGQKTPYYAVQAEDEVTAIDLALEGQGLEIDSETRDASISECQRRAPRLAS
jgi:hypothetical protein